MKHCRRDKTNVWSNSAPQNQNSSPPHCHHNQLTILTTKTTSKSTEEKKNSKIFKPFPAEIQYDLRVETN